MNIGILRVGQVDSSMLNRIGENLCMAFPETKCILTDKVLPISPKALDDERRQYRSNVILGEVHNYADKEKLFDRVLGVVDVDVFVSGLNFVFGEAECPGKAALISLWRLRPEFYGEKPNLEVFVERSAKEAVHELGHTFGLEHCVNPFCVMYFSNSIFETDRKQSLFCGRCYLRVDAAVGLRGEK
jgi:archaemetzincin